MADTEQIIRDTAAALGIDPDTAVRVARSEGLAPGVWQSNVMKNGVREPSYGPFQLLVGGPGTGFPTGMGNDFVRQTGLDPSDPSTVNAQVKFALENARRNGWSAWFGAKAAGISPWQGIKPGAAPVNDERSSSLARAMTDPILGADRRQTHITQANPDLAAPPASAPVETPMMANTAQSPLGNMLSGLMSSLAAPVGRPIVKQDDSAQVAANAAGLMERGRQLKSAFAPDVASIMALGKRPSVV